MTKRKQPKRPQTIDGLSAEDFISEKADPVWFHQNEMWELITDEGKQANDGEDPDLFK